jgi:hypothetical protein
MAAARAERRETRLSRRQPRCGYPKSKAGAEGCEAGLQQRLEVAIAYGFVRYNDGTNDATRLAEIAALPIGNIAACQSSPAARDVDLCYLAW